MHLGILRNAQGSAKKPNNEKFDLLTVSHQNGFGSAITVGALTFTSFVLFLALCAKYTAISRTLRTLLFSNKGEKAWRKRYFMRYLII